MLLKDLVDLLSIMVLDIEKTPQSFNMHSSNQWPDITAVTFNREAFYSLV